MNEVNATVAERYSPARSGAASSAQADFAKPSGKSLPPEETKHQVVEAEKIPAGEFQQSVQQAVAHMNEFIQSTQRDLQFSYDGDSGDTIVKVLDSSTKKLIRQIPDEIFLKLARELNADEPVSLLTAQA
ncbi:flagellar protein FlaG [Gilvimarinus agarilyticus]|uniref:flagellar protein FlaG n=1 Tax=unclassified Gilvimarinus TaxID=2642066 RepID=UPI001C0A3724|nr:MULTISPECIES: flagellar protein FlaG [unclassified Gilvimarinus]MBU2887247.1 flagellar protein FlaG [Gilvimarinus agarilyticus]MDO6571906.1 flagellar protein FlaG [Gilvimarinus sp. 2_MG-2023]MDO6745975.1 flagellar protein FlaG [Gilvimarinus sp. 1_MG-2023]